MNQLKNVNIPPSLLTNAFFGLLGLGGLTWAGMHSLYSGAWPPNVPIRPRAVLWANFPRVRRAAPRRRGRSAPPVVSPRALCLPPWPPCAPLTPACPPFCPPQ